MNVPVKLQTINMMEYTLQISKVMWIHIMLLTNDKKVVIKIDNLRKRMIAAMNKLMQITPQPDHRPPQYEIVKLQYAQKVMEQLCREGVKKNEEVIRFISRLQRIKSDLLLTFLTRI